MPLPEDSIMQFSKPHYQHSISYIIYADFESIPVPVPTAEASSINNFLIKTNLRKPSGNVYVAVGLEGICHKTIKCYMMDYAMENFWKT